jgi:hypothetical protein
VLGIHQDQLLMLLLVMEAELDQRAQVAGAALEQRGHGGGDLAAIGHDLRDAGARDQPRCGRG